MKTMTIVLVVVLMFFVMKYLDRPTVEVSVDTGNCIRAYDAHGDMPCGAAMKGPHETLRVLR